MIKRGKSRYRGRIAAVATILLIVLSGGAVNVPDGLIDLVSKSVI